MERELLQVVRAFELPEGEIRIEPFGNGHINRTYAVSVEGEKHRYILQLINHHVFQRPDQVQENILAVTSHLRKAATRRGKPCG